MARDPSKTERATPKRRNKAREKGSVARSQELPKVTVLLIGAVVLRLLIEYLYNEMREIYLWFFSGGLTLDVTADVASDLFFMLSLKLALMLLPLLVSIALVAYATQRWQVGPLWAPKVFKPDFSKIFNPMGAVQKLLINPKVLVNLGKQVGQAAAIAVAPYILLKSEFSNFAPLFYQNVEGFTAYLLSSAFTMVLYALAPMILIAILDTWYTRWDYEENLKMTKDEVKDERKQAEGDPKIKAEQRRKMMAVMQKRMLDSVPKADVIITNPTHIACALQYDPFKSPAPILLAKGVDHLAEKIKDIAREHRIPIRENKPLARALYKSVEIGETIPPELYQAVATLLAQLDKFKRQAR